MKRNGITRTDSTFCCAECGQVGWCACFETKEEFLEFSAYMTDFLADSNVHTETDHSVCKHEWSYE